MRFSYILTIIFLLTMSCANNHLMLGAKLDADCMELPGKIMIPTGSFEKECRVSSGGINYSVVINDEREIIYISTNDPQFQIKEIKIGDRVRNGNLDKVKTIPGWGKCLKVNRDWYAGFGFNEDVTENSRIQWFFQYSFEDGNNSLFKNLSY